MNSFPLLDKLEFKAISLKSPSQARILAKTLSTSRAVTKHELIIELAKNLNSVSLSEIYQKIYLTDRRMQGQNFAESFSQALISNPMDGMPRDAYLQLTIEKLNLRISDLNLVRDCLDDFVSNIANGGNSPISSIKKMCDSTGFSKIALMKLFQLEVFGYDLGEKQREIRGEIYESGKVRELGELLMIMDQTIQPRGRPFRTLISYSKEADYGSKFYRAYREQVSDCLCPFPIIEGQVDDFVRMISGYSISDQIVAVCGLWKVAKSRGWRVSSTIESLADSAVLEIIERKRSAKEERRYFSALINANWSDYDIYNASVANRDFDTAILFRNRADELILPRVSNTEETYVPRSGSKVLKEARYAELQNKSDESSTNSCEVCCEGEHKLAYALRYLDFRNLWPSDFRINSDIASILFESEMPLHRLLDDQEIEKLSIVASQNGDRLAVLMLRLLPVMREYSEDADYLFLRALEDAVSEGTEKSLPRFVEGLSESVPYFTAQLILALSPRRLQKCYQFVDGYREMISMHRKLLEIAAKITGDLSLVIQADQIALDDKLSAVRTHFDNSRVFVDEVLFKSWVVEEVLPSLQAIRKHIFLYSPGLPENPTADEISASMRAGTLEAVVEILRDHFVDLPICDAFRRFCLDHYFGVDSFLGRRIRHNATHGLLLGQLERLCKNAIYKDPQEGVEIEHAFNSWRREYLAKVDTLVNDKFRFRTEEFPSGLIDPGFDTATEKMVVLESEMILRTIVSTNTDTIIGSMIEGFWGLLEPELKNVRQYLKSDFTQETLETIDAHFNNLSSPAMAFAADLRGSLMERIERLASWYSPFSPADISISPSDLAQMIWNDFEEPSAIEKLSISGNARDALLSGSNVRTLYDCLHVLLVNAIKHSDGEGPVALEFRCDLPDALGVQEIAVSLASTLKSDGSSYAANSQKFSAMQEIVSSGEMSEKAMVVQGYSGLRKLRYLLFRTHRSDTLRLSWEEEVVRTDFQIPLTIVKADTGDSVN